MNRVVKVRMFNAHGDIMSTVRSDTGMNVTRKEYCFFTDIPLDVYDVVVCDTIIGFSLGEVSSITGIMPSEASRTSKWIVCKVDSKEFEKKKAKREEIQDQINALESRLESFGKFKLMKEMAKVDPFSKRLIEGICNNDSSYIGLLMDESDGVFNNAEKPKAMESEYDDNKDGDDGDSNNEIFPDPSQLF